MTTTLTPESRPLTPRAKRKRARKIRGAIGPFATTHSTFDAGSREIEISRVTPDAIFYRAKGRSQEYALPHGVGFSRRSASPRGQTPARERARRW